MKFPLFLSDLIQQKKCSSVSDLFEVLGGERKLGIALRTFRAVASGQIPPSMKFFSAIFIQLPRHMKKEALVSFFESSISEKNQQAEVCNYLSEQIAVTIDDDVQSLWSQREPQFFSEKQLRYLSSSNDIIRIYNHLVCHSEMRLVDLKAVRDKQILDDLVELEIAAFDGKRYSRTKNLYRLPHQDNSPGELVAPASDFITRHIPTFLAREGAQAEQELGYSFHTCQRRDAEKILDQMRNFKKWVQSFGLTEDHPDEVAFVWVDFARILKRGRDY